MPGIGFFERLEARARDTGSLLCVGLDPRGEDLEPGFGPTEQLVRHARALCAATADLALCWKPNSAFYEAYGSEGWQALKAIVAMLGEHAPVIVDAKRGDIGSTGEAYAQAIFGDLGADATTVVPWLGQDAVAPFLAHAERGVFALVRTSNPGAAEVQDAGAEPLWERTARLVASWRGEHRNLGVVVGATEPERLADVRRILPDAWILAPGVGAQGGDLLRALAAGRRADGLGLIVPVSRALRGDARAAAIQLVEAMKNAPAVTARRAGVDDALADALVDRGLVRFGEFTLKSGQTSPIYIDLRRLVAHPDLLARAAVAYAGVVKSLSYHHLAALPYAALPIGTALALHLNRSLVYPRREAKSYGTGAQVEGVFAAGERVVVIDDVATRGDSKLEAFAQLESVGLEVKDVVVLIDREGGAREVVEASGKAFHAVFRLSELVARWERSGRIEPARAAEVYAFLGR
ncbi:MAG: orotidine-5'-phosphate decarboxylase [Myxococcota bacterium]